MATLTVYPNRSGDSNPTSVDGHMLHDPSGAGAWSVRRDGAGTGANDSGNNILIRHNANSSSSAHWWDFYRGIFLFDTSALTSDATITSAVFETVSNGGKDDAYSSHITLVSSAPASNTALVAGDYDSLGTTRLSDNVTIASLADDQATYDTWTLNSSGLAAISKTSITKFGLRTGWDIDNTEPSWTANGEVYVAMLSAEGGYPNKQPRLVITYTLPFTSKTIVF
jgi:hypothetical protein